VEDEQRHRREERALQAAEAILGGVEQAFDLGERAPDEPETTRRADELIRLLYHQMVYIPEPEVRRRIERCARALSYFVSITGLRQDLSFLWTVDTIRKAIHDNLGPWLRGEQLPEPSETFARLIEATDAADLGRYSAYIATRETTTASKLDTQ
jgi:hypothetical protein